MSAQKVQLATSLVNTLKYIPVSGLAINTRWYDEDDDDDEHNDQVEEDEEEDLNIKIDEY